MSGDEALGLWKVLSAVLLCGNVTYKNVDKMGTDKYVRRLAALPNSFFSSLLLRWFRGRTRLLRLPSVPPASGLRLAGGRNAINSTNINICCWQVETVII
eukprot:GHVU01175182.1.p2 GENE.GHVU01175182.1~~GHVU01175182.1.p2  ORF type:complete len:100 (-),score=9.30 GHVU01175182.1:2262-2561(-)